MIERKADDRHIVVGAAIAACVLMLALSAVQAMLPGTQRDLHALILVQEIDAIGPEKTAEWLCTTEVGTRFRLAARRVLAVRGIDSSSFCLR